MTTLSVHCTVMGTTQPSIIIRSLAPNHTRLAPREVIEILCLCVRHEHFVITLKIGGGGGGGNFDY